MEMGGKNESGRVASPESVPNHLIITQFSFQNDHKISKLVMLTLL